MRNYTNHFVLFFYTFYIYNNMKVNDTIFRIIVLKIDGLQFSKMYTKLICNYNF